MVSDKPPPWPPGDPLTAERRGRVPRIGRDAPPRPDGRDCAGDQPAAGTPSPRGARPPGATPGSAGSSREIWLVEPVRGLSARRMHDEVRLGWIWPEQATDALVRWPGGEHRCSRRVYDDEGGVVITSVRRRRPSRSVRSTCGAAAVLTSPGVQIRIPARGVAVRYRIRRGKPPAAAAADHRVRRRAGGPAARPGGRADHGPVSPDDPSEGDDDRARRAAAHRTRPAGVPVGRGGQGPGLAGLLRRPGRPRRRTPGEVLLFPPPAEEMRIR